MNTIFRIALVALFVAVCVASWDRYQDDGSAIKAFVCGKHDESTLRVTGDQLTYDELAADCPKLYYLDVEISGEFRTITVDQATYELATIGDEIKLGSNQ